MFFLELVAKVCIQCFGFWYIYSNVYDQHRDTAPVDIGLDALNPADETCREYSALKAVCPETISQSNHAAMLNMP